MSGSDRDPHADAGDRAQWQSTRVVVDDIDGRASLHALPRREPLTPRQAEITGLVAQGLSNVEIALALFLTPGTVANHIAQILHRLGFRSRVQIATWAADNARRRPLASVASSQPHAAGRKVLIVEDDDAICELVRGVLSGEGFEVSTLPASAPSSVRIAIDTLEPDCVLLDSTTIGEYGESWETAAWARSRARPVPIVMFTAHAADSREAVAGITERSRLAAFAAVIAKPFDLDVLVNAVTFAVGRAGQPDRSDSSERRATRLRAKLLAAGASAVDTSDRREWATLIRPDGTLAQLYWWEPDDVYYVVRYSHGPPEIVGRVDNLDAAIELAVLSQPNAGRARS